jgi:hypothetical protein
MCVPDARRTTHDCCCCHGDAVLRRSFVIRPAPDRPCAARVRPAASTTTADAPRCRLCAAVAARRLPPGVCRPVSWSRRLVAARAGARSTRRIVLPWSSALATVSCTSSSLSARQPSARARSARVRAPKQTAERAPVHDRVARQHSSTVVSRARACRRLAAECAVSLAARRRRAGAWCAIDVCRDRPPAYLTLEHASRSSTLKVPPNLLRLARLARRGALLDDRISVLETNNEPVGRLAQTRQSNKTQKG